MQTDRMPLLLLLAVIMSPGLLRAAQFSPGKRCSSRYGAKNIGLSFDSADGTYTIFDPASDKPILRSDVAAEIDHRWLQSTVYPQHAMSCESARDELGQGTKITISNTGLRAQPDLIYTFVLYENPDFVTISAHVRNRGERPVTVQSVRSVEAIGPAIADLGGSDSSDRILSDSFSEDRPGIKIRNLADSSGGVHRAVGSQLIYNFQTKRNLFLGTLTSDKFLTILRLRVDKNRITSYEVDSTGTTEVEKENSLAQSAAEDQIELSLPVAPGAELSSERLLISTGDDYHSQLEHYGSLIRQLHHARTTAPNPLGWWSWTAYYFGLTEDTALANATWLTENLKNQGYNFFHIDEGYQYARGEYTNPDESLFPHGMANLEGKVRALGLVPGIWTAPFEVSERSWVYEQHKDWLVHNAAGKPIHAGWVIGEKHPLDPLYVLDCTDQGAQDYLRKTYITLTRDWGIRYIKLDFMDDSAIEGFYTRPNTTALEAQRIGLQIIREAVGDDVLLDKDGSPMLNPVGIVDMGRTSVDTGHTFEASKEAAPGIAARYYMHRNFYVADPDAFTVSRQTVSEQKWHGGQQPLSVDEARVSLALSAISGGLFEIGDDLPTLGADPERMALVKNEDILNMVRLGRASRPLDLMSYTSEDGMPSLFLLQESNRQAIVTIFNWSEKEIQHRFDLSRDLDLRGRHQISDVFDSSAEIGQNLDAITVHLPPHSVKMLKIIDTSIESSAPAVSVSAPDNSKTGKPVQFSAEAAPGSAPVISYHWDFGDGTTATEAKVFHAYTHAGVFTVKLAARGLDGLSFEKSVGVKVTGEIETRFMPSRKKRFNQQP